MFFFNYYSKSVTELHVKGTLKKLLFFVTDEKSLESCPALLYI